MIGPLPGIVAWSVLVAIVLALLPDRGDDRMARIAAFVAAVSTTLFAASAFFSIGISGPLWLGDRLARSLALLVTLPWLLVSTWALSAHARLPRHPAGQPGWRRWTVAAQIATAGAIVACRANSLFLMLIGFAVLLTGAALLQDRRRPDILSAALLLTGWLGAATFAAGLGRPAAWTTLALDLPSVQPMLRPIATLLLLLPMLLLAWMGAAGQDPRDRPAAAPPVDRISRALLPLLIAVPALGVVARLRSLPEPDPVLRHFESMTTTSIGVLGLVLAMGLIPGRRGLDERVSLAVVVQLAGAVIGLGVGGTGGVMAALMTLFVLTLVLPVAMLSAAPPWGGGLRRFAVLVLAGLPPFGPFAAIFVLLLRLLVAAPSAAVVLAVALLATALSLVSALRRTTVRAGTPARRTAVPGIVVIALLAWFGLAMPSGASDWLLGLAEAVSGAGAAR